MSYQLILPFFPEELRALLLDPSISDLMINGSTGVYADRNGVLQHVPLTTPYTNERLQAAIERVARILGQDLTTQNPIPNTRHRRVVCENILAVQRRLRRSCLPSHGALQTAAPLIFMSDDSVSCSAWFHAFHSGTFDTVSDCGVHTIICPEPPFSDWDGTPTSGNKRSVIALTPEPGEVAKLLKRSLGTTLSWPISTPKVMITKDMDIDT